MSDHPLNAQQQGWEHLEEREKWDQLYRSLPLEAQDEALQQFNQEFAVIIEQMLTPHSKILEAGAGAGWQSLALAQLGKFDVTLMDFSPEALNYSQRLFDQEGASANFLQGNVLEPGIPAFDLVFNAGVLEHYTFPEQVDFLKGMVSRSRKYVLVLVPNQQCYWYWIWRMSSTAKGDWPFGKEVPQSDLSTVFKAAGLTFLGQRFMAASWTELFIKYVLQADEMLRDQLLQIHRQFPVPDAQKGYLLAALGTISDVENQEHSLSALWRSDTLSAQTDTQTAELMAVLSDTLALSIKSENRLKELTTQNETLNTEREQPSQDSSAVQEQDTLLARLERLRSERDYVTAQYHTLTAESNAIALERSTLVAERDRLISERDALMSERDLLLTERDQLRDARDGLIKEHNELIAKYDALLIEHSLQLSAHTVLKETYAALLSERDSLRAGRDRLRSERDYLAAENQTLAEQARLAVIHAAAAAQRDHLLEERKILMTDRDYLLGERRTLMADRDYLTAELNQLRLVSTAAAAVAATEPSPTVVRRRWSSLRQVLGFKEWLRGIYHRLIPLRFRVTFRKMRLTTRKRLGLGLPAPAIPETPGSVETLLVEVVPPPVVSEIIPARPRSEIQLTLEEIIGDVAAAQGTYDVFIFSIIEMEARFQRPQHIAAQLARRGHRVFYVSSAKFVPTSSPKPYQIKPLAPNLYEVLLQAEQQPPIYETLVEPVMMAGFQKALDALRHDLQVYAAASIVHLPFWTPLVFDLRDQFGWKVIYDCMDEWEDFPNIKPEILRGERQLIEQSDLVTVTAGLLYQKWKEEARRCVLVRNAVNFDLFADKVQPNTIVTDIKHPIIGYYGALAEWLDYELLAFLAQQRPDWNFILLGDVFVDVSMLTKLPNVHLLGRRPHEEMPLYLYHFDVCMIPFRINKVTHAVDPVKFYEYISAGKPVVAAKIDELLHYEDYLYLAATHAEFLAKLEQALSENDRALEQRRIALARENDWKHRAESIDAAFSALYERVSIVIVSYQNVELTRQCIESILKNTDYPSYEIIIVDNASTDGTPAYLRYLERSEPKVRVILNNANKGFATANNQGIRAATGSRLVLLNNDTVVPRGWLSQLMRYLDNPEIGLVGPVTNAVGNEARINVEYDDLAAMEQFADRWVRSHAGQSFDIKMLAMFCVAMRRDLVEKIGFLDEAFGIGMFEDDDYSERTKRAGYRVVCAEDVFVHHYGQAAFKKLLETGEYHSLWERNQTYYEKKWNKVWEIHRPRTE